MPFNWDVLSVIRYSLYDSNSLYDFYDFYDFYGFYDFPMSCNLSSVICRPSSVLWLFVIRYSLIVLLLADL